MGITLGIVSLIISVGSLAFAVFSWHEAHRPMVSAYVETHRSGNETIALKVVLLNSGNMPAFDVQLHAERDDLERVLVERDAKKREGVLNVFSERGLIPVLPNGSSRSSYFGFTAEQGSIWKPGLPLLPIRLTYTDARGRSFSHRQRLRIGASEGFAGDFWAED